MHLFHSHVGPLGVDVDHTFYACVFCRFGRKLSVVRGMVEREIQAMVSKRDNIATHFPYQAWDPVPSLSSSTAGQWSAERSSCFMCAQSLVISMTFMCVCICNIQAPSSAMRNSCCRLTRRGRLATWTTNWVKLVNGLLYKP